MQPAVLRRSVGIATATCLLSLAICNVLFRVGMCNVVQTGQLFLLLVAVCRAGRHSHVTHNLDIH